MSSQPEPVVGDTVMLPEYAVEVAELLAATEGHADANVRAVRKILTQAAVALTALTKTSDPAVRTEPAGHSLAAAPGAGSEPTKKRASSAAVQLLNKHNLTAAQVRAWCATAGVNAPARGALPLATVEAYIEGNGLWAVPA